MSLHYKKVIYPTLDPGQNLPTFRASDLQIVEAIAPTVSVVLFEQQKFAYKKIDRPIYEPSDTDHILDEIEALAKFQGQSNIAQLVGLVISENHYKTNSSSDTPEVITGFLLEYYSGGSLEEISVETKIRNGSLLIQWALQIGSALESMHESGRTHLDIKPSNILLDARGNAILIDISGTGGYDWEWLSPEMQGLLQRNGELAPVSAPWKARIDTDQWAYGRLLATIAEKSGDRDARVKLQSIAGDLMRTAPEARISLCDALAKLQ
ncbi:hypothetical protein N7495_004764 [Penicillium taxi]|uniref:uncharacterized protein n=1 Tax=Penicillium taxi TaxID=168475 RepID=UPI0025453A23|nr:uncharacterized protein N7495_004764 [Penicillium taxi]KAJ5900020.1 hypothetical protein N7495_004764 [Penicillium taxi]